MRIATWNVNSLKARQEAVERWLERAAPDILLVQETKLTDGDAPVMAFAMAGYQLVHHGEGRWNGVAIAAREGLDGRRRRHELRRRAGSRFRAGRSGCGRRLRGRLQPVRRGPDGRRHRRRAARREPVRAERPGGRITVLRGQARLVRPAAALDGRRADSGPTASSSVAISTLRRPISMSGTRPRRMAARTSRSPSGPPSER